MKYFYKGSLGQLEQNSLRKFQATPFPGRKTLYQVSEHSDEKKKQLCGVVESHCPWLE